MNMKSKYLKYLGIALMMLTNLKTVKAQITIQLPANPQVDTIPKSWRGHNHTATSLVNWYNNPDFLEAFPQLNPGIIRWPGGNLGNNYNWLEQLNNPNVFNLEKVAQYLQEFKVALQVVTNFGNGSASEAAEFVRFCNSTLSVYAQQRNNLLGDSSPLNVKYWEIGNESTDGWAFKWSWMGFQDFVKFRTSVSQKLLVKREIDSLYYYGGSFFREGWVNAVGGMDNLASILGDTKFYSNSKPSDTIKVEFPRLDINNALSVRVFRTSNFDAVWGTTIATQQQLYDSISNPLNLLLSSEYTYSDSNVIISPSGGINPNDIILIEYNSIGHDGAFAFRDSMKAADSSIEVGFNVSIDSLANNIQFQTDFANSPPDFMVSHPYPTNLTKPAVENGLFSEISYVVQLKVNNFINTQQTLNQRETLWGVPVQIGQSLTEWNSALCDDCPANHPLRGIASGLYIADFWANIIEKSLQDSIDLRTMNHFALIASGSNFIHLFHNANTGNNFWVGTEGIAARLLMQTVGMNMFLVTPSNVPQISVIINQLNNTTNIPAIEAWGGTTPDSNQVNLLIINRDDVNTQQINLNIPVSWQADSITTEQLYGTMTDDTVFTNINVEPIIGNTHTINAMPFSITAVKIHHQGLLSVNQEVGIKEVIKVYPNPFSSQITMLFNHNLNSATLTLYNSLGQIVKEISDISGQTITLQRNNLPNGLYILKLNENNKVYTYKIIISD